MRDKLFGKKTSSLQPKADPGQREPLQRREDVKIGVSFTTYICACKETPAKKYAVQVRDISAGGFCFYFSEALPYGSSELYEIVFNHCRIPLVLNFSILWRKFISSGRYAHGCEFSQLAKEEQDIIREYVYQLQLNERKNNND